MDIRPDILIIIIGSALVTAIPRIAPMVLLSRIALPAWLRAWLGAVPVAILAALLASELLVPGGRIAGPSGYPALLAILPVLVITALTRSLMGAVIAGMLTISLLRAL
ncbi:MAG: AzlD domain-containing protein [Betaproteobacteria bacterium]|nr:AzlD domain-containing protein [Betaproteobacteria bacterium]